MLQSHDPIDLASGTAAAVLGLDGHVDQDGVEDDTRLVADDDETRPIEHEEETRLVHFMFAPMVRLELACSKAAQPLALPPNPR